jgi:hypothetical protein
VDKGTAWIAENQLKFPSGPVSCPEREDEADNGSPTCRPTPGQPDSINDSHILRKVEQSHDSDKEKQSHDDEIGSRALHDCLLLPFGGY